MSSPVRSKFGETEVVQTDGGTVTYLPDGSVLVAVPEDTDSYRETSRSIGYGEDTAAMCREHDWLHVALAQMLGLPVSPALRGACRGEPINDLTGAEEDAVLAIQRFWNLARKGG